MTLRRFAPTLHTFFLVLLSMTYTSLAQPFKKERKIVASDDAAVDNFGAAVALSGDTAVCTAPFDDDGAQDTGSVYIFERGQGGPDNWGEVKKLTASDAMALDQFGRAVAASGNLVVVGTGYNDDIGIDSGAVYIFERDLGGQNNWGQVKKLTASDAGGSDYFGERVAVDGDVVVVGAPYEDDGGLDAGAAYIFVRDEGGPDNWGEVRKLIAADAAPSDQFGITVAITGDTIIVGAFAADDAGPDAGAAYVFERHQGGPDNWGEVKKLIASDAAASDQFGRELAASGDTIVVGVYADDDAGDASGSAYIFERHHGGLNNWGEFKKLTSADATHGDQFGRAVSISGDIITVAALRDDGACPADPNCDSGSAYVFERDQGGAGNWGQVSKLTASDAALGDLFGRAISMSDDTLIFGAPANDDGGSNSGSAYIFSKETTPALTIPSNIPTPSNLEVNVPISYDSNGKDISSIVFSIDFDEACLSFDPADADSDGIPDAVTFSVPPGFTPSVTFSGADTAGELDIVIADFSTPLANFIDGVIAMITLRPICVPSETGLTAPVNFGLAPAASFGNTSGQSEPGTWVDGSVKIFPGIPGDCNDDGVIDAGDISACVLEVFDSDGNVWTDVVGGSFLGSAVGCDANQDYLVGAGDLSCKILLLFNGAGACTAAPLRLSGEQPEIRLGHAWSSGPGEEVAIPLTFSSRGQNIAAAAFSIDYEETCLSFDLADGLSFNFPAGMTPAVSFDVDDKDGELDITVLDSTLPLAVLQDGLVATLRFTTQCGPGSTAVVRFSSELSFGSNLGQSVSGLGIDGGVTFTVPIFGDSFESGSTALWSQTVP